MPEKNKIGQEEIVGFALIVIIVAIILVVILGFSLRKGGSAALQTSYQAESFTQALLQYTSECISGVDYLSMQNLIISCNNNEICNDGTDSCQVLNETLKNIIEKSWQVGENNPVKGYELKIGTSQNGILDLKEGNETAKSRGSIEDFTRSGEDYELTFKLYS